MKGLGGGIQDPGCAVLSPLSFENMPFLSRQPCFFLIGTPAYPMFSKKSTVRTCSQEYCKYVDQLNRFEPQEIFFPSFFD